MVRNEKNPRGDSIAERYGPPVTASDVEDLLYRERVPASSIYKIMQAVRSALSWSRSSGIRPWAGELEDGLTRQEERRAEERRARLAEALREEGRAAAATTVNSPSVNSDAKEALSEALADAWAATAAAADLAAPGSPLAAKLSVVQGGAGTITPTTIPEPATALSGPPEPEVNPFDKAREILAATEVPVGPVTVAPPTGSWLGINRELFAAGTAAPAPAAPAADAPAPPAAAPSGVADPAPGTAPPPAPPEPATGLSEPRRAKRCTKCGVERPLGEFQKDRRASDGARPSCKLCSSQYDALRRSLKKSLHASTETAVDEAVDAMEAEQPSPVTQGDEWTDEQVKEFAEAVKEYFPLPPDTRGETVVLIPKFDPPPPASEGLTEELEGDPDARTCNRCGILKGSAEYYTRKDGRLRFRCKECEREESRNRKLTGR